MLISSNMKPTIQKKKPEQGIEETIEIPSSLEATLARNQLVLKKGELNTIIHFSGFRVHAESGKVLISSEKNSRKEKRAMNTFKAHLKNALQGFEKKYVYKLQISAVHFPMTVTYDKTKRSLVIKNFLGEKIARVAHILPGVEVKVEKDFVIVESHDRPAAGQSAANIEQATRVSGRDRRVFQDGVWIIEKAGEAI